MRTKENVVIHQRLKQSLLGLALLVLSILPAQADYVAEVGSFAAATVTGNQEVDSGTGVVGKAIIFWGHKATADGNTVHAELFFGAATSSTERWAIWGEGLDAQASSKARRYDIETACIEIRDTPTGGTASTANGRADFVSFGTGGNAGKFTINWSDAPAAAYIINYMYLAGTDLTNAKAGAQAFPTGTGNQVVTGVGFQGDFGLFAAVAFSSEDRAPGNDAQDSRRSIGFAQSSTARGVASSVIEDSRPAWRNVSSQAAVAVLEVRLTTNGSASDRADFVSFDASDGFTLNWSAVGGGTGLSKYFYLVLKGGQYEVGNFSSQAATGNFNVTTAFQGVGCLYLSGFSALGSFDLTADHYSLGAATSSTARGAHGHDSDESEKTADQRLDRTAIYVNLDAGTPTLDGDIDFVSFNSANMTLNQTDADPAAQPVLFALFGQTAAAGAARRKVVVY